MKFWKLGRQLLALGGGCVLGAGIAFAQGTDAKPNEVAIDAHIVDVARLEPTRERINGLKLPAGFKIAKFAELQNPRMIAVADDGTVYISQRDSGTLVMLRDTNNDGRADIQRVVATRKGGSAPTSGRCGARDRRRSRPRGPAAAPRSSASPRTCRWCRRHGSRRSGAAASPAPWSASASAPGRVASRPAPKTPGRRLRPRSVAGCSASRPRRLDAHPSSASSVR